MGKYSLAHLLCNQFDFEVPLEDLCPPNYLHPKIVSMYNQALRSFNIHNITLDILTSSKFEGPEDKIEIKETLLNFRQPKLNGTPQSFIWLIEHFLGLLPIPLLASYINGYCFRWFYLSQECRAILQDSNDKKKSNSFDYCDHHICDEIRKLPSQHKLLLNQHIAFIRNISILDKNKTKRSIVYYCKYFTESLLLRPFRSGLKDSSETDYYFLIVYMALRWPSIYKTSKDSIVAAIREVPELDSSTVPMSPIDEINIQKVIYCGCSNSNNIENRKGKMTSSICSITQDEQVSRVAEDFSMLSVSGVSVENSDTQAEEESMETADHKINIHNISKEQLKSRKNNIGSHEDDALKNAEEYSLQKENTETGINKGSIKIFHKNVTESEPILQKKHESILETRTNGITRKTDNIDTIHAECQSTPVVSCTNPENITIDTNILKRISKVGWTYTPQKTIERHSYEINLTKNISDDETTQQELIKGSQSEIMLKNYPSVKSFRSRLSIFKIGKKRTCNKKLNTNFKYTKINS